MNLPIEWYLNNEKTNEFFKSFTIPKEWWEQHSIFYCTGFLPQDNVETRLLDEFCASSCPSNRL